jgi:hypothetical protein
MKGLVSACVVGIALMGLASTAEAAPCAYKTPKGKCFATRGAAYSHHMRHHHHHHHVHYRPVYVAAPAYYYPAYRAAPVYAVPLYAAPFGAPLSSPASEPINQLQWKMNQVDNVPFSEYPRYRYRIY